MSAPSARPQSRCLAQGRCTYSVGRDGSLRHERYTGEVPARCARLYARPTKTRVVSSGRAWHVNLQGLFAVSSHYIVLSALGTDTLSFTQGFGSHGGSTLALNELIVAIAAVIAVTAASRYLCFSLTAGSPRPCFSLSGFPQIPSWTELAMTCRGRSSRRQNAT